MDKIKEAWLKPFARNIYVSDSDEFDGLASVKVAANEYTAGDFVWVGKDLKEGLFSACEAMRSMKESWDRRRDLLLRQEKERRESPDFEAPDVGELGEETDINEVTF